MNLKGKLIISVLIASILFGVWFKYESQYFNKIEFLSPIEYEEGIPIRDDVYGSGEFNAKRKAGRVHKGLDMSADIGTPVKAMRSGRVINAEEHKNLGKYVEIRHRGGFVSIYAHLSMIYVKKGQRVRQGQIIGAVGKTGNAMYSKMKSHLHFEIRKDGRVINPRDCLEGAASVENTP